MAALRCVSIIRNTIESTTRAATQRQELLQAVAAVRRDLRNGLEAGERRISNDWLGSARAGNRFSGWDHMARPPQTTCSKDEPAAVTDREKYRPSDTKDLTNEPFRYSHDVDDWRSRRLYYYHYFCPARRD